MPPIQAQISRYKLHSYKLSTSELPSLIETPCYLGRIHRYNILTAPEIPTCKLPSYELSVYELSTRSDLSGCEVPTYKLHQYKLSWYKLTTRYELSRYKLHTYKILSCVLHMYKLPQHELPTYRGCARVHTIFSGDSTCPLTTCRCTCMEDNGGC